MYKFTLHPMRPQPYQLMSTFRVTASFDRQYTTVLLFCYIYIYTTLFSVLYLGTNHPTFQSQATRLKPISNIRLSASNAQRQLHACSRLQMAALICSYQIQIVLSPWWCFFMLGGAGSPISEQCILHFRLLCIGYNKC